MLKIFFAPPSTERVEKHTKPKINERIKALTIFNINKNKDANYEQLTKRLIELNKEWDTERVLEANAALFILISSLLVIIFNINWIYFIIFISFFLLYHSIIGWCPPLPIIRRMKIRTTEEINHERMAIRFLRGDFKYLNKENYLEFYEMLSVNE